MTLSSGQFKDYLPAEDVLRGGNQHAAFYTPRQIKGNYDSWDALATGTSNEEMWKAKGDDERSEEILPSIQKEGVQTPIDISPHRTEEAGQDHPGLFVFHGHHRAETAYRHRPDDYVPVRHALGGQVFYPPVPKAGPIPGAPGGGHGWPYGMGEGLGPMGNPAVLADFSVQRTPAKTMDEVAANIHGRKR